MLQYSSLWLVGKNLKHFEFCFIVIYMCLFIQAFDCIILLVKLFSVAEFWLVK